MVNQLDDVNKTKEQLVAELTKLRVELDDRKRVEEDLRRSNALLQAERETSIAGIWVVNEHREVIFYNQRFCELWQIPQSVIETNDYWQILQTALIQLQDADKFLDRVEALYQSSEEISHDEIFLKNGRVLDRRSAPMRSPSGTYYGRVWHFQDITEIKQAEAALRKSEEKFIKIFRTSPDPISIVTFPEERYLEANESFYCVTGYCLDEVIGNTTKALHLWTNPEEHTKYIQSLQQSGSVCNQEATLKTKSGAVKISLQSAELIELDAQTCLVAVSKDITHLKQIEAELKQYQDHLEALVSERTADLNQANTQLQHELCQRKQVEAILRESERRFRTLLEEVRLLVFGEDMEGNITYVNPCMLQVTGYTQEEVMGKNFYQTFLPQEPPLELMTYLETMLQGLSGQKLLNILTRTGESKKILTHPTLLRNADGEIIGILSIAEDVTERYQIERMKDEFISVVSHEFRTPLTAIHGALDLISNGLVPSPSDRAQQLLTIAVEGSERLIYLVDSILALERLESGDIKLLKQPCYIANLMTKAADLMQLMAANVGVKIVVSPLEVELEIDGDRILQVLTNLLSNAIKFSPSGGTVWLHAELQGGDGWENEKTKDYKPVYLPVHPPNLLHSRSYILFSVKDQGRGIPSDKLEIIFERFQQVDTSDSRQKGGTGLGLAICRSIVEQHGGHIWAESTLGEGSCFYMMLPIYE